jgi:DNA primase
MKRREGRFHCSIRTMYRLLEARGESHERRDQLAHPPYQKPELLATAANQLWRAGCECVVVVEGFFDAMKLHQAGYQTVVALMGSSMSDEQEELPSSFAKIILMLDGDEVGRGAAQAIALRLVHRTFVKVVDVPLGKQPDELSPEQIKSILGSL